MTHRNLSSQALLVLAILFSLAGFVLFVVAMAHAKGSEDVPSVPGWVSLLAGGFALAGVMTGTGWLVLRGVNYELWFRQTHPGEPLHQPSADEYAGPSDWKAAERTPGV